MLYTKRLQKLIISYESTASPQPKKLLLAQGWAVIKTQAAHACASKTPVLDATKKKAAVLFLMRTFSPAFGLCLTMLPSCHRALWSNWTGYRIEWLIKIGILGKSPCWPGL